MCEEVERILTSDWMEFVCSDWQENIAVFYISIYLFVMTLCHCHFPGTKCEQKRPPEIS